jgi:hypothetical protein
VMSAFLAVYFQLTLRSAKAMLPEDDLEGEISDSAGPSTDGAGDQWACSPRLCSKTIPNTPSMAIGNARPTIHQSMARPSTKIMALRMSGCRLLRRPSADLPGTD